VRGEDYEFLVTTVEKGDPDAVMLDRVPAEYFEMPYPTDPTASAVQVRTLGVLAGSKSALPPAYSYHESLTPRLVSLSPSVVQVNSALTLRVANIVPASDESNDTSWLEDLRVDIGDDGASCSDGPPAATSPTRVGTAPPTSGSSPARCSPARRESMP